MTETSYGSETSFEAEEEFGSGISYEAAACCWTEISSVAAINSVVGKDFVADEHLKTVEA